MMNGSEIESPAAPSKELAGKVALITGAAGNLGTAIAHKLAASGARLVLSDISAQKLEKLTRDFYDKASAICLPADIADSHQVERMFTEANEAFGGVDILVNNAGIAQPKDIFELTLEDWELVLKVNLTSVFLCSKLAMEQMRGKGWGRIINISSVSGQQGAVYGHVHYSASKAGILGFTKALARTAAPLGITVNAVAPGVIESDLVRAVHGGSAYEELSATIPLGLGKPEDVAETVVFLAGDAGRYITGATIDVNGGLYFR